MIEDLHSSVFEGMNSIVFRCVNVGFDGPGANTCTGITKDEDERIVVTLSLSLTYWRLLPANLFGQHVGGGGPGVVGEQPRA